jgi:hypothetical protein
MPKLSIYLPETTFGRLRAPENVSARIAEMVDGYAALLRDATRDCTFTRREWCALCAHYARTYPEGEPDPPADLIWPRLAQDGELEGAEALSQRLRALPLAAQYLVREVARSCRGRPAKECEQLIKGWGLGA